MKNALARLPPGLIAVGIVVVPYLLYVLSLWYKVPIHHGLPIGPSDPDSWLRLTLVRAWLEGGSWYSHAVTGTNTPFGGISSPWTRPLDLVIAALVHLEPPTVDLNLRLARAALLLPVLWMGLLLIGMHRLLRLAGQLPSAYLWASIVACATPMLWNYFGIGNADHHAPLAAIFIWAVAVVFIALPPRRLVILSGALLGLQLWVSVEAIILIFGVYAWYGLRWLRGEAEQMRILAWLASAVALTTALANLTEHAPTQWALPIYDSISVVYVFILALCALAAWVLMLANPAHWLGKLLLSGAGGMVVLGLIYRCYPLAFKGPLALADPYIFTGFLPFVSEAQPLYKVSALKVIGMMAQPLMAVALCLLPWLRPNASYYTKSEAQPLLFFILLTSGLYVTQIRWNYYLFPMVAVAVAPYFGALFAPQLAGPRWPATRMIGLSEQAQMMRRLPILLSCLALPLALIIGASYYESIFNENATAAGLQKSKACQSIARQLIYSGALNRIGGPGPRTLFASTNLGAEILFWTPHRIVASNYHREGAGLRYMNEAYDITKISDLRRHFAQRHVDAALICPLSGQKEDSALHALQVGAKSPPWLQKIDYPLPAPDANVEPIEGAQPVLFLVKYSKEK